MTMVDLANIYTILFVKFEVVNMFSDHNDSLMIVYSY